MLVIGSAFPCECLKVFVCVYKIRDEKFVSYCCKGKVFWFEISEFFVRPVTRYNLCVCFSSEAEAVRNLCCDSFDTCGGGNVTYGR
jgi:hypothetical protein